MFERFLEIRMDLRGTTRKCYRDLFSAHVNAEIGNKTIGKIKQSDIQKMYQKAVVEHGVTPSTVQKVHSVVCQIFEIAVNDNIIRTNPAANAFKHFAKTSEIASKQRDALTLKQQEQFIDFVYSSRIYNRLGNLFTVLLGTGLRIGEALALTWDDIDFDAEKAGSDARDERQVQNLITFAAEALSDFCDIKWSDTGFISKFISLDRQFIKIFVDIRGLYIPKTAWAATI